MSMYITRAGCLIALALASSAFATAEGAQFTITHLKPLPGTAEVQPVKINDHGDVLGFSTESHPFLYKDGIMQELFPGGEIGNAIDINNAGQIICYLFTATTNYGVLIQPNGEVVRLSDLVEGSYFYPTAINDSGEILASSSRGNIIYSTITRGIRTLQDPETGNYYDLNNSGEVVGATFDGTRFTGAGTLYTGNNFIHFQLQHSDFTVPTLINNRGLVAGYGWDYYGLKPRGFWKPNFFVYDQSGFVRIPRLPGDNSDAPSGMNDNGDIVGWSARSPSGPMRAFLYKDSKMHDLNSLIPAGSGWTVDWATSINNNCQIVGIGTFNSEVRGFLLTPTGK